MSEPGGFVTKRHTTDQAALTGRLAYYLARDFVDQLRRGDDYDRLPPSVVIVWLPQPLLPELVDQLHSIFELRERGMTVFLVEHHMRVVMNVCDVISVLDYGRKIAEGSPQTVSCDERVIEAYLGADKNQSKKRGEMGQC